MSSVGASSTNNPYSYIQSLWQQQQSQSGAAASADPLSQLLAALGQQGSSAAAAASAGSSAATTSASGTTFPQFGSQMLQALLALQSADNGTQLNAEGLTSTGEATSGQQAGQTQQGCQSPSDLLTSADAGATSQTTANANGSNTTTITYGDGSTVALTTAAPSSSSSSSDSSSSSAGGTNVAANNLIEQLIEMQAQLLNPATTQSVATV